MRNLTKQEMSDVTGAIAISCFTADGFAWLITGSSVFEFDAYNYSASCVKDRDSIVFSGHSGEFQNPAGKTCYVTPFKDGNVYRYYYDR